MSGLCLCSTRSLAFVTLNPNLKVGPCPLDRAALSLVGPLNKELEAEGRRLSLGLVLCSVPASSWCPCCLETGFLPYSSMITSLLGVPVSFQIQRTHFEFFVRLLLISLPICLLPGPCFHFQPLNSAPPSHLPFRVVDSSSPFGSAVRPRPCYHLC